MSRAPITKLTIDRSKWACRTNNAIRGSRSFLKDAGGFKCCLGFLAEASGVDLAESEVSYLTDLALEEHEKLPLNFRPLVATTNTTSVTDTDLAAHLANVNDTVLSNKEREADIKHHFKLAGIDVTFVGKYLTKP